MQRIKDINDLHICSPKPADLFITMAVKLPELPAAYELVCYDEITNMREKASELAEEGAPEGTLIWAKSQSHAVGRLGQKWYCNEGDLHCTIILRPEFAIDQYPQILLVGAVSLGNAIATYLSPMTSFSYHWPNDVTIVKHKVAAVWLDIGPPEGLPWLSLTVNTNIKYAPEDPSLAAISIKEIEGESESSAELNCETLLENYAKQFITQINNWSERGMDLVVKQWKSRAEGMGEEIIIRLINEEFTGVLEEINNNGDIVVRLTNNTTRIVTLADYVEYIKPAQSLL